MGADLEETDLTETISAKDSGRITGKRAEMFMQKFLSALMKQPLDAGKQSASGAGRRKGYSPWKSTFPQALKPDRVSG